MKSKKVILFAAAILFSVSFVKAQEKSGQRPNIVFVEVDDLMFEFVGFNGADFVETPNMDKLADEGVFFKNAVCQGTMCGPSRNSLMTGLYPHNLGFYLNGEMRALPKGVWTFPQGLQNAGYYTAWIGKCHIRPGGKDKTLAMETKMGFDFVEQTVGRVVLCRNLKKGKNLDNDWYISYLKNKGELETFMEGCDKTSRLSDEDYLDGFFTGSAIKFLDEYDQKKPLFLWLNYTLPHGPYDVPEKYHTYKPEDMPGSTAADFTPPPNLVKKTKTISGEQKIKEYQAGYCANISFLDDQIGKIVDAIKKKGIYDETVIVFFSDHGLMMGNMHRIHKGTLFREVTDPLLVVSWPEKMKKDLVNEDPVELIDLIRTTLELADARPKDLNMRKTSVSLLPALYSAKHVNRKYAFSEVEGYVMVTDGRYRLIKGDDAVLLFDDEKDPYNLKNIAGAHPEIVKEFSKAIDDWFKETGKPLPPRTY